MIKRLFAILLAAMFTPAFLYAQNVDSMKNYLCHETADEIVVDGFFNEPAWQQAEWITDFEDIRGGKSAKHKTQVKMLYDNNCLFLAVMFYEPHICADITENEQKIYLDNAFELFIDPNDDALDYYEFEINANGTTWDLQLDKPYSKGGNFNSSWNIAGLEKAISINGTLNNPTDIDSCWAIELAIPFSAFAEYKNKAYPVSGEYWRVNLLRVDWHYNIADGKYVKKNDKNGKPLQSDFWVWSPQKRVNMHIPERWGKVEFKSLEN